MDLNRHFGHHTVQVSGEGDVIDVASHVHTDQMVTETERISSQEGSGLADDVAYHSVLTRPTEDAGGLAGCDDVSFASAGAGVLVPAPVPLFTDFFNALPV